MKKQTRREKEEQRIKDKMVREARNKKALEEGGATVKDILKKFLGGEWDSD